MTTPDALTEAGLEEWRDFSEEAQRCTGGPVAKHAESGRGPPAGQAPLDRAAVFTSRRDSLIELSRSILIGPDDRTTGIVLLRPREQTLTPARRNDPRNPQACRKACSGPRTSWGSRSRFTICSSTSNEDGTRLFYASLGLLGLVILGSFASVRWVLLIGRAGRRSPSSGPRPSSWSAHAAEHGELDAQLAGDDRRHRHRDAGDGLLPRQRAAFAPAECVSQNGRRAVAGHSLDHA